MKKIQKRNSGCLLNYKIPHHQIYLITLLLGSHELITSFSAHYDFCVKFRLLLWVLLTT